MSRPVTIRLPEEALAFLLDGASAHADTLACRAASADDPLVATRLLRQAIALTGIADAVRSGVREVVS